MPLNTIIYGYLIRITNKELYVFKGPTFNSDETNIIYKALEKYSFGIE